MSAAVPAEGRSKGKRVKGPLGGRGRGRRPRLRHSLLSHAGVFQDVHVDQKGLLVFAHAAQQQRALLQQA